MAVALQNRPDLEALRIGIRTGEFNVSYARNQALPNLSFTASLWSPGVSGTRLIYPASDPFGDPIGRIPGGRSDSLKDVFGFKLKNVSFGFTLDIPVSDLASRAALAQAKVDLDQRALEFKNLEQEVLTKIKIALRETEMNFKRIHALKRARELAQKQLATVPPVATDLRIDESQLTMENSFVRVRLDAATGGVASLAAKPLGAEVLDPAAAAFPRFYGRPNPALPARPEPPASYDSGTSKARLDWLARGPLWATLRALGMLKNTEKASRIACP